MTPSIELKYNQYYSLHCKHLKLLSLHPKAIEPYSRAIRRIAPYFESHLDNLSQKQLLEYFYDLLDHLSWSPDFHTFNRSQATGQVAYHQPRLLAAQKMGIMDRKGMFGDDRNEILQTS